MILSAIEGGSNMPKGEPATVTTWVPTSAESYGRRALGLMRRSADRWHA
jgi:hypothetical protein